MSTVGACPQPHSAAPSASHTKSHTPGCGANKQPPPPPPPRPPLPAQGADEQGRHGPVHRLRPQRVHLQPGVDLGQREHLDGVPPCAALAPTHCASTLPGCELATPCAAGHSQRGRPCCGRKISVDGEAEHAPEVVQVARRLRPFPGLSCCEGDRRQAEGRLSTTVEAVRPQSAEFVVSKLQPPSGLVAIASSLPSNVHGEMQSVGSTLHVLSCPRPGVSQGSAGSADFHPASRSMPSAKG